MVETAVISKYCPDCKTTYPDAAEAFNVSHLHADGTPHYRKTCKKCGAKSSREWRKGNKPRPEKSEKPPKPAKPPKPQKVRVIRSHPVIRLVVVNTDRCTIVVHRLDGSLDRLPYDESVARDFEADGATDGWIPVREVAS